ncbi:MAG TPA: hypothetical protein VHW23_14050 [Kofleriaceae bacterium]|jgi:hypothetical protein|nr:hypothetical protein [Kofleriaceae bacterium]
MKPVLLLALLALGPALAEQFPLLPRPAAAALDTVAPRAGTAPPTVRPEVERLWLCGR